MTKGRTELQREIVDALISSKAIDFEAVGNVIGKYGARAALAGDALWVNIHHRMSDVCIPPFPFAEPSSVSPAQLRAREQE
jgi:hypothetical protein